MNHKQINTAVLVVGQGLAGTCLSYQLHKKNIDFLVLDNSHYRSSSLVAAGLINPVVFKRLTKSWMADDLMPYLDAFYQEMEGLLNCSFYEKKYLLRILKSAEEINTWQEKKGNGFENYLGNISSKKNFQIPLKKESNLGRVNACSVDISILLNSWRDYISNREKLITEKLGYSQINFTDNGVEIQINDKKIVARKIIFCEGAAGAKNPLFSWLPFNLSKGDILTLKNNDYLSKDILNNGNFYLPTNDGVIKMGSTYNWNDLSYEKDEEGKKTLLEKAQKTLSGKTELINHQVGIRPTVKDRRPFLGRHPKHNNAYIFNGLGTKGAMLAPYFSEQMMEFIVNGKKLSNEVDILRFG
ncbi:MAG: FAD-binding oxidoreductase [Flavobacteriales bacterium]|nr:FAD-binding oxidoreductase [Flavobacteriales bacterium]